MAINEGSKLEAPCLCVDNINRSRGRALHYQCLHLPPPAQQLSLSAKLSFTISVISHFYDVLICNILGKDLSVFPLYTLLFPGVYNQAVKTHFGAKLAA